MARSLTVVSASISSWASSCSGLCADLQVARRDFHANAAVLLVGQDRSALQRGTQCFTINLHFAVGADRDHRFVVRETAIDQLRSEGDIVALDADVATANFQLDLAIAAFQQALQLGDALARHDDLALGTAGLGQVGSQRARR